MSTCLVRTKKYETEWALVGLKLIELGWGGGGQMWLVVEGGGCAL